METLDIPDMVVDCQLIKALELYILWWLMGNDTIADQKDVDTDEILVMLADNLGQCQRFRGAWFDLLFIALECNIRECNRPFHQLVKFRLEQSVRRRGVLIMRDEQIQGFQVLVDGIAIDLQLGVAMPVLFLKATPYRTVGLPSI